MAGYYSGSVREIDLLPAYCLLLLLCGALLLGAGDASATSQDVVAETSLAITSQGDVGTDFDLLPNTLYVFPPATVTFQNQASFSDSRNEEVLRMLVIDISANSQQQSWFSTTYTGSYQWADLPTIQVTVTGGGSNPEHYRVNTDYYVYQQASGWLLERQFSLGGDAYVYKV